MLRNSPLSSDGEARVIFVTRSDEYRFGQPNSLGSSVASISIESTLLKSSFGIAALLYVWVGTAFGQNTAAVDLEPTQRL